jgi:hypothetical protein
MSCRLQENVLMTGRRSWLLLLPSGLLLLLPKTKSYGLVMQSSEGCK